MPSRRFLYALPTYAELPDPVDLPEGWPAVVGTQLFAVQSGVFVELGSTVPAPTLVEWLDTIDYVRGGYVAHNGVLYVAVADSTGIEPGTDGAYWLLVDAIGPVVLPATPTDSADTIGNEGDLAGDDSYLYFKTSLGWKRAALEVF